MSIQVVRHQHDAFGARVVDGQQPDYLVLSVDPGPLPLSVDPAPPGERLDPHEDRTGAVTDILRVLLQISAGRGGNRGAGEAKQLVRLLVHTHHRHRLIEPTVETKL